MYDNRLGPQRRGSEEGKTAVKIILTQDVAKLGIAGSLQEVKPGYARNYLIPQGMAQVATAGLIKQVQEQQAAEQRRIAKQEVSMQSLADRIQGLRLTFTARAGETGASSARSPAPMSPRNCRGRSARRSIAARSIWRPDCTRSASSRSRSTSSDA